MERSSFYQRGFARPCVRAPADDQVTRDPSPAAAVLSCGAEGLRSASKMQSPSRSAEQWMILHGVGALKD
ncbi:hypothetical protein AAFF_G00385520 [Aldrovandia affinis]|uniref:Uncharacterized protein n=1 Tax=Aldrovandia affinis TaxID=143900 RepID=A0AAD7WLE6_9TELE|nr:hypothetical protein AAFF_G00385520 [Aldrovandia affinis]